WKTLSEADLAGVDVVAAEVYPSLLEIKPLPGEAKDLAQVRTTAEHFAKLDEAGRLGAAFAPAKGVATDVVADAEREEGWVLGA
ncbi:MAG TPA: cobalamin biosynthesis protein CbiG, partial [Caulobacteraceae bacterium]|nr:cobalamin biosynthesis protein CbiG [Caulobacteraceae bacterium]